MTSTDFAQPDPASDPNEEPKESQAEGLAAPDAAPDAALDEAILRALRGQGASSEQARRNAEMWQRERGFGKIEVYLSVRYVAGAERRVLCHRASYTRMSDGRHGFFLFLIDLPNSQYIVMPDEARFDELAQLEDQYTANLIDPVLAALDRLDEGEED